MQIEKIHKCPSTRMTLTTFKKGGEQRYFPLYFMMLLKRWLRSSKRVGTRCVLVTTVSAYPGIVHGT